MSIRCSLLGDLGIFHFHLDIYGFTHVSLFFSILDLLK